MSIADRVGRFLVPYLYALAQLRREHLRRLVAREARRMSRGGRP